MIYKPQPETTIDLYTSVVKTAQEKGLNDIDLFNLGTMLVGASLVNWNDAHVQRQLNYFPQHVKGFINILKQGYIVTNGKSN